MGARLIFNPTSGRKAGIALPRPALAEVVALLGRRGIAAEVRLTAGPGHATALAAEAVRDGCDTVIVAGGDGTVHEALQPLVGTPVRLGLLPLGSVMNLARALAIPRTVEEAVGTLRDDRVIAMDVGEAANGYFVEAAGLGLDAGLFAQLARIDHGDWSALRDLLAFARAFRPVPVTLDLDGRRVRLRALLVLVANTPSYGAGIRLAPRARIDDGWLDVVVIGDVGKPALLRHWLRSLVAEPPPLPATRHFRARAITVAGPPGLPAHADALPLADAPHTFRVRPAALRVYAGVPPDARSAAFDAGRCPRRWPRPWPGGGRRGRVP